MGVGQLEVPMASYWALHKALVPARRDEYALGDGEHIRAIAAPVVAAELTRWADELMGDGYDVVARNIQRRADELDGGSRG
jgi:hypothetical protein